MGDIVIRGRAYSLRCVPLPVLQVNGLRGTYFADALDGEILVADGGTREDLMENTAMAVMEAVKQEDEPAGDLPPEIIDVRRSPRCPLLPESDPSLFGRSRFSSAPPDESAPSTSPRDG